MRKQRINKVVDPICLYLKVQGVKVSGSGKASSFSSSNTCKGGYEDKLTAVLDACEDYLKIKLPEN